MEITVQKYLKRYYILPKIFPTLPKLKELKKVRMNVTQNFFNKKSIQIKRQVA